MYKASARKRHHNDFDIYNDIEKIKMALSDTAKDVKGKTNEFISQSYENAKEKSLDFQNNIADYVSEKPFKSLSYALLTGIFVGLFLRRK